MTISDQNYKKWIQDISSRFRQSQIKAATYVNEEMLRFYWNLGHDIHFMENTNGSGLFNKLSRDLKKELPNVKSFSVTNLHYMSWFYELYPDAINLPSVQTYTKLELPCSTCLLWLIWNISYLDCFDTPKAWIRCDGHLFVWLPVT